jgi:hypothetical protein
MTAAVSSRLLCLIFLQVLGLVLLMGRTRCSSTGYALPTASHPIAEYVVEPDQARRQRC